MASRPTDRAKITVIFGLRLSTTTIKIEQNALNFAESSPRLQHFVRFDSTSMYKVEAFLPHMFKFNKIQDEAMRDKAETLKLSFNDDQRYAHSRLRKVPGGTFFMTGCPCSGKTRSALSFAALSQMQNDVQGGKVRVLYLVDFNSAVDEIAERMGQLYASLGMDKLPIRMFGWPKEIRRAGEADSENRSKSGSKRDQRRPQKKHSDRGKKAQDGENGSGEDIMLDFSSTFVKKVEGAWASGLSFVDEEADTDTTGSQNAPKADDEQVTRSKGKSYSPTNSRRFQTLDDAAWQLFQSDPAKFPLLKVGVCNLELYRNTSKHHNPDMDNFNQLVAPLYKAALDKIDFIATTPVAAGHQYFYKKWKPTIVFFDEARHAREASTLVPMAFFPNAKVHVLLGDPRQNQPFSNGGHAYEQYLKVSALQRADEAHKVNARLLMNRRALAGLEELPSKLFYDGKMIPDPVLDAKVLPESTIRLRKQLNSWRHKETKVPRLLVSLRNARWKVEGTSPYNPLHERWIMRHVKDLLGSSWFTGLDQSTPGSILIVTPMKAFAKNYRHAVDKLSPTQAPRVDVRTIETAAGAKADVVFVDIVKSGSFVDDKNRLNVALTRAKQGEVIFMRRPQGHDAARNSWLSRIFERCEEAGQVLEA